MEITDCKHQKICQFHSMVSGHCRLDDPSKCIIYSLVEDVQKLKDKII